MSSLRYQETVRVRDTLQDALEALQTLVLSTSSWRKKMPNSPMSENKSTSLRWVITCTVISVIYQIYSVVILRLWFNVSISLLF